MLKKLANLYRRLAPQYVSPLEGNGERVDIDLTSNLVFESLDIYQKSHYKRYLFARDFLSSADVICGDFACGSGYGSALMAQAANRVVGIDINQRVVDTIADRYSNLENVQFICANLLEIDFAGSFDVITSFETIEHVSPKDAIVLLKNFSRALKGDGTIIFSTPYLQKRSRAAVTLGFHLTFDIDEAKIAFWLKEAGLVLQGFFYQNYKTHEVLPTLQEKDFVICVARKLEARS